MKQVLVKEAYDEVINHPEEGHWVCNGESQEPDQKPEQPENPDQKPEHAGEPKIKAGTARTNPDTETGTARESRCRNTRSTGTEARSTNNTRRK